MKDQEMERANKVLYITKEEEEGGRRKEGEEEEPPILSCNEPITVK
jgi:hypothetical protein